jgi:hypothetical protein
MTDRLATPALRLLPPAARLLGTGDDDALQNVDTTSLPHGCLCFVVDQGTVYVLDKASVEAASGTAVVVPASGPGRWAPLVGGAAESAVISTDFALSAEWGVGASLAVEAGSNNLRGQVAVTAGTGPSPGGTITLTFNPPFSEKPFGVAQRNDTNNPPEVTSLNVQVASTSPTTFVMRQGGASSPIEGLVYTFAYVVVP